MPRLRHSGVCIFAPAAWCFLAFTATCAQGQSTWTANSSGNWGTASNWDTPPISGDSTAITLTFNLPTAAVTLTNDLADPFILNSLVIASNTNQAITLTGGALQFNGVNAVLANNSTQTTIVTIGNGILIGDGGLTMFSSTVGTAQSNNSQLIINGNVGAESVGAVTLTLSGSGISLTNRISGVVSDGVLGGTLGIYKTGSVLSVWTLSNSNNSFSGGVTIDQGTLRYFSVASLGGGGPITLGTMSNTSGTLSYFGTTPTMFTRDVNLDGTGVQAFSSESTTGVLTVTNTLSFLDSDAKTLALSGASLGANDFQSRLTDNGAAPLGLQKTGAGVWVVSNTNNNFTGGTTIFAGTLRVADLNTQLAAGGALRFGAAAATVGVLETSGSLTNSLGTGAGQIAFGTGVAAQNAGGFSAFGGTLDVTLNNDDATPVLWHGAAAGTNLTGTTELQLNSTLADNVVTIHNSFTLGTGSHRIRVTDNLLSTADMGVLSGDITGSGGITSTGAGVLVLSGNNTYTGGTTINAGSLRVSDPAVNLNLNVTGSNLRFSGTNNGVGGVLETAGSLTNSIGTAAGQISWLPNGSGGFSAYNDTLDVTLNNNASTALVWGSTGFVSTTHNLLLSSTSANNVVTFRNSIDFNGLTGTVRVYDNPWTSADYAVMSGTLTNGALRKVGTGLLVLSGNNTFNGGITLGDASGGGVLRGDLSANLNLIGASANNLTFAAILSLTNYGVVESSGTLTNSLGAGHGQIQWGPLGTINATTGGSGGFSAYGGALSVTLNDDAATPLVWNGTAGFLANNAELQFGSAYSDNVVTFQNAINLSTLSRSIRVTDNPDSSADAAVMAGVISSATSTVGIFKQGTGTLILTADNTYTGTTSVLQGNLQLGDGGTSGSVTSNINAAVNTNVIFDRSDMLTMDKQINGAGSLVVDGPTSGGVTLSFTNSYTGTTTIQSGTLRYGIVNAVPTSARVFVNTTGTLDVNGTLGTIAQLNDGSGGAGIITNNGATLATLTISSTTLNSLFTGLIQDGTGSLQINKAGAGTTLTLGGTNTYSGGTTLVAGNLFIANDSALGTGTLRLVTGVFDAGTGNRNLNLPVQFAGTTTVTGGGNLAFTALGSSVAATSIVTLSNGGTVTINGLSLGGAATFAGSSALTVTGDSTVTAAVTLTNNGDAALTFNNLVLSNNLTFSGVTSLVVSGALSASGANRTFTLNNTGGATFNDIAITATGDTVSRMITLTTLTNSTITVNGTISDGAQAEGGLTLAGAGNIALNGDNTFSGLSTLLSGTVLLGHEGALGTGTLRFAAGTLDFGTGNRTIDASVLFAGTALTMTGDGTVLLNGPGNTAVATSIVTLNNTGTVTINNLNLGAALTFAGTGAVNLAGTSNVVAAVTLTNNSDAPTTLADVVLSNNLTLTGTGSFAITGVLSSGGGNRTLTANNFGGAAIADIAITTTGDDTPRMLTLATLTSSTLSINGVISDGAQAGSGLAIAGASTSVVINGSNSFSGGVSLLAGTLIVGHNNALGTGPLTGVAGLLDPGAAPRTPTNDVILLGTFTTTGDQLLTLVGLVTNSGGNRVITANNTAGTVINGTTRLAEDAFGAAIGRILTVAGAGPITFNNVIENGGLATSGSVSITNTGGVAFTADNTFSGRVTIAAGSQLTVGAGGTTGNLPQFVSVNTGTLIFNRSDVFTYSGVISGGGPVVVNGPTTGGVQFDVAQTYTGYTTIDQGTLRYDINNALPVAMRAAVNTTGTLDLNGFVGTLAQLSDGDGGGGVITNGAATAATLTVSSTTLSSDFSGKILDGTGVLGLYKASANTTLNLSGSNAFSGGTTLVAGNLAVTNDFALGTGTLRLIAGVFDSGTGNRSLNLPLTLAGTVTLTGDGNAAFLGTGGAVAAASNVTFNNTGTTLINGLTFGATLTMAGSSAVTVTGDSEVTAALTLTNNNDSALTFNNLKLGNNVTIPQATSGLVVAGMLSATGTNRTITLNSTAGLVLNDVAITAAGDTASRVITMTTLTNSTITVNGTISDGGQPGGGLILAGAGSTVLNGSSTFSGTSSILSGSVLLGSDNALGTGTVMIVGGFLDNSAAQRTLINHFSLLGTLTVNGDQQLTVDGAVTNNAANRTIWVNNPAGVVLNGDVNLAEDAFGVAIGRVLTLTGSGPITINGVIANGGQATTGTVTIANTAGVVFAGDNTFSGRTTINLGAQLTVGAGGATGNLPQLVNNNGGLLTFNRSTPLTYSGVIAGTGGTVISGPATGGVQFNAAQTYTGFTTIDQGSLIYGINNALPVASTVLVNSTGTLDIGGFNGTVATLSDGPGGGGVVTNGGAAAALTINQGNFSGILSGANLSLIKTGVTNTTTSAGVLVLSGANTFGGASTLSQGTIVLGNNQALSNVLLNVTDTRIILQGDGTPRTMTNGFNLLGNITFSGSSDLTLNGTFTNNLAARTITVNNTGVTTFNGDLMLSQAGTNGVLTLALGDGADVVIAGALTNATNTGGFTVTGNNGQLQLTGTSDVRVVTINGNDNTVELIASAALQLTNTLASSITVSGVNNVVTLSGPVGPATALVLSGTNSAVSMFGGMGNGAATLSGSGSLLTVDAAMGNGALALTGTNSRVDVYGVTGSGAISLTGAGAQFVVHGGGAIGNSAVVLNNDTVFELQAGATAGTGAITTFGSATVILNGTKGIGNITLDSGAVLAGSGSSAGTLTTAVGSNVFVGGSGTVGTLTLGRIVLNGGTLRFDLGAASDLLISTTLPLINSTATINVAAADGFGVGSYTLISGYTGTFLNTNRFNIITPVGYQKDLESLAGSLILHLTAAVTKSWSGGVDNIWDDGLTANFNGQTYDDLNRDAVSFLDGAANTNVTISTGGLGVAPTSVLVNNSATTYTFDGDPITGDGQLSKQGDGLLVILNDNTFTGGIQISAGNVQLGNGGATGRFNPTSNVTLNNDAQLLVNHSDVLTLSGNIAGTGAVIMNGSGTLQLAGINTYFNGSTVNSGAFEAVGAGVLNEFGGWTVNGGTMNVLSSTNQVTQTVNINGGVLNTILSNTLRTVTATVVNVNGGVWNVQSGNVVAPTVNVNGGAVNLDGPTLTPSLLFNLASGTVNLNSSNLTLSLSQFGGGLGDVAVVNVGAGMTLTVSNTLTYTANNNAAVDPNGAVIQGDGSLAINASRSFTINDSANAEYDLTIALPIVTATGQFTKAGLGTLYLQGANASSSMNTLAAGALAIGNNAALGTGTLWVAAGAIRGDGTPRTVGNYLDVRGAAYTIDGNSDLTFASINNATNVTLTVNNGGNTTITSLVLAPTNTAVAQTVRGTGTVDFISILAGTGTGDDSLIFDGQGIYNLRGANTYSGYTSVRDGTVVVYDPAALAVSGTVYLGIANTGGRAPSLLLDGGVTLTNNVFVSTSGTGNNVITLGGNTAAASAFAGNITFSQGVTLMAQPSGTANFTGVLDDFGALVAGVTVTGGGTVVLSGANTYAGTTIVSQGVLQAGSASALGAGSQLQLDAGATFDLNGFGITLTTLTDDGGGTVANGGLAATLTVGNGSFTGTLAGGANLNLVKNTSGTLTLGGTNTYSGTTLVADGTLVVGGTLGNTALAVGSSGTLAGAGFIAGTVTSSGTIAPGTSPGTLTLGGLVLNGGNLNFELDTTAGSDAVVLTGGAAPSVNSATALNITVLSNFDEGTYHLISGYGANTIAGGDFANLSAPTTLSGLNASLQNNAGSLDLVVSAYSLVWSGTASNAWNASEVNWSGDLNVFAAVANVNFDNTTGTNDVVIDAAGVSPHNVNVNNDGSHLYTFSGGAITGDKLLKNGVGTLVLAGDNAYTRGVSLNAGELVVGNGSTSGSLAGDVVNNALLSFNRSDAYTFAGNISGIGALQQLGTGTLVLTGNNTFTGPTTVNAGWLDVQGNYASTIYNNTGVQSTVASNTTGNTAFTAPIVGNVLFQQNGTGVTTLSGASTYTGGTQVNSGTLIVGNSLNGTQSVDVNAGGAFQVAGGASLTTPGNVTVVGTANVSNSTNNPGVFVADGTVNADAVVVQQGGLLMGSGTISGPVIVETGAGLAPGNSVDGQIMSGGLTLSQGSSLYFDFRDAAGTMLLDGGTGPGYGWDLIDLQAGILNLGDATALNTIDLYVNAYKLDNTGHAALSGDLIFDPLSSYEWLFIKVDNLSQLTTNGNDDDFNRRFNIIDDLAGGAEFGGVFDTASNNPYDRPFSSQGMGTFTVAWKSGVQGLGLYIQYSAIPEPGSMILAGLASLGAGWYGRRRMRKTQS